MGTWSAETFGNDSACDWAGDFLDDPSLALVEKTLEIVLAEAGYLDSDDATGALAACEIIARLCGRWGVKDAYSEKLDQWVVAHPAAPDDDLIEKALRAIDRITADKSELSSLWEGSEEWLSKVADLRLRVSG